MARKPGTSPQAIRERAAKTAAVVAPSSPLAPVKKRTSIPKFFAEVRAEARKITWTSRRETWITSVMVGMMVVAASAFLFGADAIISVVVNKILSFAQTART